MHRKLLTLPWISSFLRRDSAKVLYATIVLSVCLSVTCTHVICDCVETTQWIAMVFLLKEATIHCCKVVRPQLTVFPVNRTRV